MAASVGELLKLHRAFWNRQLARPIINIDCSLVRRTKPVPALPSGWEDQDTNFVWQWSRANEKEGT